MKLIAMIFLEDNILLERQLTFDDIKPRLLGHWGTCPGLVLVYAHLNRIIKKTDLDSLLVVGPGESNILTLLLAATYVVQHAYTHTIMIVMRIYSCIT
jgi:phosphoketolase